MFISRWLPKRKIGPAARRSPFVRHRRRPRLEALEDRCVPASGWVNWMEWPGAPDSVNPAPATTSDAIDFTLFSYGPADIYSTYPSLTFDLPNKAIDVVFLPTTGGAWVEPPQGLYGQLWALEAGNWLLRGPQATIPFTVTGDPVRWLEISDGSVAEGDAGTTDAVFTVSLSVASSETVTVDFTTADRTAAASDNDYVPVSGALTFAPGETTKTITVQVNGDTVDETYEEFHVNLSNPTNALLGPNGSDRGWGTIRDDESSLWIYEYWSPAEGNSGTTSFDFVVYMLGPSDQPVTVNFATADGTARASDNDYVPTSGLITFAPGEDEKFITVPVNGDTRFEFDETFFLNLSNPTNATIADGQGQGTIRNDDPFPSLTINDVTVTEGHTGTTSAVFTVSLSAASGIAVPINYASANDTASAGDYGAVSGTLTFAPGETTKTITVLVNGDRLGEPNETFFLNLSHASGGGYAFITDGQGQGTILDDEPRISINNVTLAEGRSGITYFVFTVSLSAAYDAPVSVNFATANGTATTANKDYVATSGTLTFAPGETTKTITVEVKGDRKKEANETFFLNLSGVLNALLADSQGLGTILNDD